MGSSTWIDVIASTCCRIACISIFVLEWLNIVHALHGPEISLTFSIRVLHKAIIQKFQIRESTETVTGHLLSQMVFPCKNGRR